MKNASRNNIEKPAQAIVELVVILPLLMLLIFGSIDFGRFFFNKIVIINAAREGVNYLSRHPTDRTNCDKADPSICYLKTVQVIQEEADSSGVNVSRSEIQFTSCCTVGNPVQVKITKNANLILGSVLSWLGVTNGPIQLSGIARMVVQ
jgi:Flp pilus assembly protein TadG